jgi:hypothetical protein
MIPDEIYQKILRSAVKAPSGHNTQPWLFSRKEDGFFIHPDFSRALPVADPQHRELFISLGCLAETAMIAAQYYGYRPSMQILDPRSESKISISLQKDETMVTPGLYPHIHTRQTTRNLFSGRTIPAKDLSQLHDVAGNGNIRLFTGQREVQQFSSYIAGANAIQMGNPAFKKELIRWMRFSGKEAMHKGDGLYTACSGIPSMGRMIGSLVLKSFVNAASEHKRYLKQLEYSAAVVLFTSPGDGVEDWINTGMVFQRFALTATQLGLSSSFLNLPCQVAEVREQMIPGLRLKGEFPQLIIRLGYSAKMPYSFRRRAELRS